MDRVISLYHFTSKNNLKKIIKDGYLRPFKSEMGKGIFLIINMDKNLIKKRFMVSAFGNYLIELNKNILTNRKDFYIREALNDGFPVYHELFGGKIVFDMKKDNKSKLNKVLKKLTLLNEVIFKNKISLKKYIKNIYTVKNKELIPLKNKYLS